MTNDMWWSFHEMSSGKDVNGGGQALDGAVLSE